MKKKLMTITTVLALVAALSACSSGEEATTAPPAEETTAAVESETPAPAETEAATEGVTFVDARGLEINMDDYADSFVLFPKEVEAMFSITQDLERYKGINGASKDRLQDTVLPNYYPGLLEINGDLASESGGFIPNVEEVLSVNPDVVFQWSSTGEESWKPLEDLGIPVVTVGWGDWSDDLARYNLYGSVLGESERMEELMANQESASAFISETVVGAEERQNHIYLETYNGNELGIWGDELPHTYIHGLDNAAYTIGNIEESGAQINLETLLSWNPDVIIINSWFAEEGVMTPELLMNDEKLQSIDAIKNKRVYVAPSVSPLDNANLIWYFHAMVGYPELFADTDVRQIIRDDHKFLYNIDITDEDIDAILNLEFNQNSANFDMFMS